MIYDYIITIGVLGTLTALIFCLRFFFVGKLSSLQNAIYKKERRIWKINVLPSIKKIYNAIEVEEKRGDKSIAERLSAGIHPYYSISTSDAKRMIETIRKTRKMTEYWIDPILIRAFISQEPPKFWTAITKNVENIGRAWKKMEKLHLINTRANKYDLCGTVTFGLLVVICLFIAFITVFIDPPNFLKKLIESLFIIEFVFLFVVITFWTLCWGEIYKVRKRY